MKTHLLIKKSANVPSSEFRQKKALSTHQVFFVNIQRIFNSAILWSICVVSVYTNTHSDIHEI